MFFVGRTACRATVDPFGGAEEGAAHKVAPMDQQPGVLAPRGSELTMGHVHGVPRETSNARADPQTRGSRIFDCDRHTGPGTFTEDAGDPASHAIARFDARGVSDRETLQTEDCVGGVSAQRWGEA